MKNTGQAILYVFLFLVTNLYGENRSLQGDPSALDSSIRYGVLPNGLTYYIKPLNNKTSELDIQLLIKAGRAQEDSAQIEMAHVMEHYGINNVEHSPNGKFYDVAKKADIKYTDVRGWIYKEATVYSLKTSKENKKAHEIGLLLFQDILYNVKFNSNDITKERFTLLNEYDSNKGGKTSGSILNQLMPSITGVGSEFPSDFEQHLRTFKESELIRFYKDWYHPNLAAIVVVGAIDDVDNMEKIIKEKFSKGSKTIETTNYDRIKKYKNYLKRSPQFLKKSYDRLTGDAVEKVYFDLYFRHKEILKNRNSETLEARLQRKLFLNLLNNRFRKLQQSYGVRYLVSGQFVENPLTTLKLRVTSADSFERESLVESLKILRELQNNGFTNEEYTKEKKKLMSDLSSIGISRNSYWLEQIQSHFIHGEHLPEKKGEILCRILEGLSMEDFNSKIRPYLIDVPDDIVMLAQEDSKAMSYSEKEIRNWFNEVDNEEVTAFKTADTPLFLMEPSAIQNLRKVGYTEKVGRVPGSKEFKFKNGLTLVFKSSATEGNQNNDMQVAFKGYSETGAACYTEKDLFSAINSANIVQHAGVGGINKFELMRYNVKNKFKGAIRPYINYNESGITSRNLSSLEELETALQLVHLYFTAPNMSNEGFEEWKYRALSTPKSNIIEYDMEYQIKRIFGDETHIPRGTAAIKGVSLTDMERSYTIYRDIFGNTADFTFLFIGSFPEEEVLSLCQKYLGNLPSSMKPSGSKNIYPQKKIILPQPISKTFFSNKDMEDVWVELIYTWDINRKNMNWKEKIRLDFLGLTMNRYLYKKLRFDSVEGNTYSTKTFSNNQIDRLYNEFNISFSAKEEHIDYLVSEAKRVVELFKNGPVDKYELESAKKVLLSILDATETKLLPKAVYNTYRYGSNWVTYKEQKQFIQSYTPDDLWRTTQKVFKKEPFEFRMQSEGEL